MPRVITRCRTFGAAAPTQLLMSVETFHSVRLPEFAFACPVCGRIHAWAQQESWVDGEEPAKVAG